MIFGMVLGRLAVLKISDWAVKYATFEGNFFNVFMGKKDFTARLMYNDLAYM